MDGFLRVDHPNLPDSPTNSFLADEVASICPLITPSPPTNALINPLPEPEPDFSIGLELANKLNQVNGNHISDEEKIESGSSSSSEPPCAQLLNHRNVYNNKKEEPIEENLDKSQILQLTFRNPPDNYFFMSWNWVIIRKISAWAFLSGIVAMVAIVIFMIIKLPKTCNPPTFWYQGNLLYEINPSGFHSSNSNNKYGDFKGILMKVDYIHSIGVRGVRLNSIFDSPSYPIDSDNVTSLVKVAPTLGTLSDFNLMVENFKTRNISVILDLPVYPYVKNLLYKRVNVSRSYDVIEESILHWLSNGVNGFYFKGLEKLTDDPNLVDSLRRWKNILGENRCVIVNESFFNSIINSDNRLSILNQIDLVDVKIDLSKGVYSINRQIRTILNSTLFTKPGMPWIQWSLSNIYSNRISTLLPYNNGTLGATILQLMLPGTPSILYGDEFNTQTNNNNLMNANVWNNVKLDQIHLINKLMKLRLISPSIYMNAVNKEGVTKANMEIKYAKNEMLVVQRWYPRRKAYVLVSNLGTERLVTDLSTLLYSGEVVIGPQPDSVMGTILFKEVLLWPGESVVVVLN